MKITMQNEKLLKEDNMNVFVVCKSELDIYRSLVRPSTAFKL